VKYLIIFFVLVSLVKSTAQSVDSLSEMHVDSLIQLARQFKDLYDYDKAFEMNDAAMKYCLDHLGPNSEAYSVCCFNRGLIFYDQQDYEESEKWFLQGKAIIEKIFGKENSSYANVIKNLSNIYFDTGNYSKSEQLNREELIILEKIVGKVHPDYISSVNNLAVVYVVMGNYSKAESLLTETMSNSENILGPEHPETVNCITNLAILYYNIASYERGEVLFIKSKKLREKIYGKEDPEYASSLNNLAELYRAMGDFEKAEPLLLESKAIIENKFGKEHSDYIMNIDNLGALYWSVGNYSKAEEFFIEAKEINEKTIGKDHPDYAYCIGSLATLYQSLGNYSKAEPLLIEVIDLRKKTLGVEHPDYAFSMNSLATLYTKMGENEKTEKLYAEVIQLIENSVGKKHPYYALGLNNLANLYADLGKFRLAENLYSEIIEIQEAAFGRDHPEFAFSLNNLGDLYVSSGRYDEAEKLYLEVIKIREKVIGKEHPDYASCLISLSHIYEIQNKLVESEALLDEFFNTTNLNLRKSLTFLSEQELARYVALNNDADIISAYQVARQVKNNPEGILPALSYDQSLFQKGFLLSATSKLTERVISDPDTEETYNQLKSYRRMLAQEYSRPIIDRDASIVLELEEKANIAEKKLAKTVVGFEEANRPLKWHEVQMALSQKDASERMKSAAIEFVHFNMGFPGSVDSILYGALLLLPGGDQPQFVSLFSESEMLQMLQTNQPNKSTYIEHLYAWRERDTVDMIENGRSLVKLGRQKKTLYELIWEKIEAADLKDVKTIYYAPSGILHRINMGAIAIDENQRLSDRYNLIAVNSTRQIVTGESDRTNTMGSNAIVYGGIQFEADTTGIVPQDESEYPLLATRSLAAVAEDSTLRGGTWQYLHWTQKEAEVISTTLSKGGLKTQHRSGLEATEESFKAMGQSNIASPRVLHIATHGFFFPDPAQETAVSAEDATVFKWSDNPMIRSGLILAGGNYAWQNGKPVSPDKEDGILTAYEISQMNLSNTELVVLSACETGLGDIQGNEGVYGLQRAFKIAGAKYLIMSLWQVPDRETMEFMTTFYKNWLEGKMTIPDAFRKTQGEMRDRFGDVFSWGAFVLVE
jgi:CHAT domain-containing protein